MIGQYHPYLLAPDYISSFSLQYTCTLVICANLQFQAEEHSEEDKTKAEEADGQADQPSEQSSLPGRVVELLTARYGTAALHSLQRQQRKNSQGEFQRLFFHVCDHLIWKMVWKCLCKMCSITNGSLNCRYFLLKPLQILRNLFYVSSIKVAVFSQHSILNYMNSESMCITLVCLPTCKIPAPNVGLEPTTLRLRVSCSTD